MFKAVIFDMDGVIIDSEPIYQEVEMSMFRELGIEFSEEERSAFTGTNCKDMWRFVKQRFEIGLSVEELVALEMRKYRQHIAENNSLKLIEGVADLVNDLVRRGIIIAIASSSPFENIEMVLQTFGLKSSFKVSVSGDEVLKGKPAPDIFNLAVVRLELTPEECIVVEDSSNGVKAAKAAGIKCVGFRSPNSGNQDLSAADLIIGNFGEINYSKLKELCESA